MCSYLSSLGIPIIEGNSAVTVSSQFGKHLGVYCKKITNASLYKPIGSSLIKLSTDNLSSIQNIFEILTTHKLLIGDLQFLYNDKELYIIDPFYVYKINTPFYIGCHSKRKHNIVYDSYTQQIKKLKQIIEFNTSSSL